MQEKIIKKINESIERAKRSYDLTNKFDAEAIARIDGMIDVLSIMTEKEYVYDENGIRESK